MHCRVGVVVCDGAKELQDCKIVVSTYVGTPIPSKRKIASPFGMCVIRVSDFLDFLVQ